jgi:hypothetical protein
MINFILDKIGEPRIVSWLMDRVKFSELGEQENKVLQEVFFRVPYFKKWLKQMQVRLLRNTLVDKSQVQQREGQILFIELLLANDKPSGIFNTKVEQKEELKLPNKEDVISKWNKDITINNDTEDKI